MTKETMTIHEALTELKTLDSRIETAIENGGFCLVKKHSDNMINGMSLDDVKAAIQGKYDKATALIQRRKAIKKAVVLSNAVTKITLADKEYTVAEAIELKNYGMDFEHKLLAKLIREYNLAQSSVAKSNGKELEVRTDSYIVAVYGTKENATGNAEIEQARESFIKNNQFELFDVIDIAKKIEKLENEIAAFESKIDSALSVSNALTKIEIEY